MATSAVSSSSPGCSSPVCTLVGPGTYHTAWQGWRDLGRAKRGAAMAGLLLCSPSLQQKGRRTEVAAPLCLAWPFQ